MPPSATASDIPLRRFPGLHCHSQNQFCLQPEFAYAINCKSYPVSLLLNPIVPSIPFVSLSFSPLLLAARAMTRAATHSTSPALSKASSFLSLSAAPIHFGDIHLWKNFSVFGLRATVGLRSGNAGEGRVLGGFRTRVSSAGSGGGEKGYRKGRKKALRSRRKEEPEFGFEVFIEEGLPHDDPQLLLAFEVSKTSEYKTRDTSIKGVRGFETIELSVLLCNDEFIRKLNKEWRGEDHATDVISTCQHIPGMKSPILMLGDIVMSVETAARQAEEQGHELLDEIRILLVHGLLHLLGFDHEISEEAEAEMKKAEELLSKNLGWKEKGLIKSASDAENNGCLHIENPDGGEKDSLKSRPKFKYIFCDMDGTLLNSKGQVSYANANALREAMSRGIQVIIATGKTHMGAMNILKTVGLIGRDGVLSKSSPGVFIQGLLVYGRNGQEIFRRNLDPDFYREAFLYSLKHEIPLVAYCGDRCLTLFDHPLVEAVHSVYCEPKAEIMPTVESLLAAAEIQKLLFLESIDDRISAILRPYCSKEAGDHANVIQAIPETLELVPHETSKGDGVKLLLDHLGASSKEIMAIGDGENGVEMLRLAGLGVALSNGSEKAKAVADVIGISNDEDGVADTIYRFLHSELLDRA